MRGFAGRALPSPLSWRRLRGADEKLSRGQRSQEAPAASARGDVVRDTEAVGENGQRRRGAAGGWHEASVDDEEVRHFVSAAVLVEHRALGISPGAAGAMDEEGGGAATGSRQELVGSHAGEHFEPSFDEPAPHDLLMLAGLEVNAGNGKSPTVFDGGIQVHPRPGVGDEIMEYLEIDRLVFAEIVADAPDELRTPDQRSFGVSQLSGDGDRSGGRQAETDQASLRKSKSFRR